MRLWRPRRQHWWARSRPPRLRTAAAPLPNRAILEFGASGARAALVRIADGDAEVLATGWASGPSGIVRPGWVARHDRLVQLAERALSSAEHLAAGVEILPVIADEAVVGLSGPLLEAQLTVMHFPRRRPGAPVSDRELAVAMLRTQRIALKALAERAAAARIRHRHISAQLVGALVDGERLREPYRRDTGRAYTGPRGETLSLAICNVIWPLAGIETVERVLASLELEGRGFIPLAQAVAAAAPLPDTILIDVGHQHTEVALAEGGALSYFRTFPLGGAHFTERLEKSLRLSPKAAELASRRYSQGQGAPDARAMISAALEPLVREWRTRLEQTLLHLAGRAPLPAHIFLYGGGSMIPDLMVELRNQPWIRRLPFERYPEVELLTPQRLRGVRDPSGRLQGSAETPSVAAVGLAALCAWAAREPGLADQLLSEISTRVATAVDLR